MAFTICPKCGKQLSIKANYFRHCDTVFTYCPECKSVSNGKVTFCPSCGSKITSVAATTQSTTQSTTQNNATTNSATSPIAGATAPDTGATALPETAANSAASLGSVIETPDAVVPSDSQVEVQTQVQPQVQSQPQTQVQEQPKEKEDFSGERRVAKYKTWQECRPDEKKRFSNVRVGGYILGGLSAVADLVALLLLFIPYVRNNYASVFAEFGLIIALLIVGSIFSLGKNMLVSITNINLRLHCADWLHSQNIDSAEYIKEQINIHGAESLTGSEKEFYKIVKGGCYLSSNPSSKGMLYAQAIITAIGLTVSSIFEVFFCLAIVDFLDKIFSYPSINAASIFPYVELILFVVPLLIYAVAGTIIEMRFDDKVKTWINSQTMIPKNN
ncbi:MAG: zinc ribbon domain-containing protein [Candidatus Coproplasma sp.]